MLNLEVKKELNNFQEIKNILNNIGAQYYEKLIQKDTYFKTGLEKIKTREINSTEIQLIKYLRLEKKGKKESTYTIEQISKKAKKDLISKYNPVCEVKKIRELWIYKNTRIHLDKVEKLGYFLELETVVKKIPKNEATIEFNNLVKMFKIKKKDTTNLSYSDMILQKNI